MLPVSRAIQGAVFFSAALGAVFLWQVNGLVPGYLYDALTVGWVCFLADCLLTVLRPRLSYAVALVLATLALASSLPESAHYTFIETGDVVPASIFVLGTTAQFAIIVLAGYYFVSERRGTGVSPESAPGPLDPST